MCFLIYLTNVQLELVNKELAFRSRFEAGLLKFAD